MTPQPEPTTERDPNAELASVLLDFGEITKIIVRHMSRLAILLVLAMLGYFVIASHYAGERADKTNALIRADFERLEMDIRAIQPNLYQNGKPVDSYFDGHNWYDLRKGTGKR
jgi:hypothetical protein